MILASGVSQQRGGAAQYHPISDTIISWNTQCIVPVLRQLSHKVVGCAELCISQHFKYPEPSVQHNRRSH